MSPCHWWSRTRPLQICDLRDPQIVLTELVRSCILVGGLLVFLLVSCNKVLCRVTVFLSSPFPFAVERRSLFMMRNLDFLTSCLRPAVYQLVYISSVPKPERDVVILPDIRIFGWVSHPIVWTPPISRRSMYLGCQWTTGQDICQK